MCILKKYTYIYIYTHYIHVRVPCNLNRGNLTPKAESAQRCGKLAKLGCRVRRCRLSANIESNFE